MRCVTGGERGERRAKYTNSTIDSHEDDVERIIRKLNSLTHDDCSCYTIYVREFSVFHYAEATRLRFFCLTFKLTLAT